MSKQMRLISEAEYQEFLKATKNKSEEQVESDQRMLLLQDKNIGEDIKLNMYSALMRNKKKLDDKDETISEYNIFPKRGKCMSEIEGLEPTKKSVKNSLSKESEHVAEKSTQLSGVFKVRSNDLGFLDNWTGEAARTNAVFLLTLFKISLNI